MVVFNFKGKEQDAFMQEHEPGISFAPSGWPHSLRDGERISAR